MDLCELMTLSRSVKDDIQMIRYFISLALVGYLLQSVVITVGVITNLFICNLVLLIS